jgi:mannose-6-phosphate isomerase-like protein (cupin superfamily)
VNTRRIVTGTVEGRSVVVSDGQPPRTDDITGIPGFQSVLAWSSEPGSPTPNGTDPTMAVKTFIPASGSTRLIILTLPPDAIYADPAFDPELAGQQQAVASPGLFDLFEPDAPGFHTTPTVDYGIVLSGTPALELDDGSITPLSPGDVVVQNGTRHSWRNPGTEPARFAFVLIGS